MTERSTSNDAHLLNHDLHGILTRYQDLEDDRNRWRARAKKAEKRLRLSRPLLVEELAEAERRRDAWREKYKEALGAYLCAAAIPIPLADRLRALPPTFDGLSVDEAIAVLTECAESANAAGGDEPCTR